MSIDVRNLAAGEVDGWSEQMALGFHYQASAGYGDYLLQELDLERTWAGFDGSRVVGTLRSWASELTLPGARQVRAAALTNVTVAPTHRRAGLLTQMITADLQHSVELGEAVGILIASEYPIYGRYGYGPAIEGARYSIDTLGLRFVRPGCGRVEIVDRVGLREVAPAIYDRVRVAQTGQIERPGAWWDRTLQLVDVPGAKPEETREAVYRSPAGELEGYLRYAVSTEWDEMRPKGVVKLKELVAETADAYQGLWEYCANIDLLITIEAGDRAVDEPLPFLLHDGRAVKQVGRYDFIWVRVLDVPAMLAGRRYSATGRVVIEVVDPLGYAEGRFELDGGPDHAECRRSDGDADLTVPVQLLGSVSLGGFSLQRLADVGLVDEHRSGAVAAMDAMFSTARQPWCNTWF